MQHKGDCRGERPWKLAISRLRNNKWMRCFPLCFVAGCGHAARCNFFEDPASIAATVHWLSIALPLLMVPLIVVLALRLAKRRRVEQPAVGEVATDLLARPWTRRPDWAMGRIESESLGAITGALGCLAVMWNGILAVFIYAWLMQHPSSKDTRVVALVLSLFLLVGIALAVSAIVFALRWRRYGKSYVELETIPGVIGGRLAGRVWAKLRPAPSDEVQLSLQCVRRHTTGSGKDRQQREDILWETSVNVQGGDLALGPNQGVFIPVEFFIPRECETTTSFGGEDGILWRLQVRAKVRGPDYTASFQVPVFVTEASDSPEAQELEARERRKRLSQGPPPGGEVRITPTMTGGTQLYWPPLRHVVGGLILVLVAAGFIAAIYLIRDHGAIFAYIVLVLFAVLFGAAAAVALGGSARIQLEPDGRLRLERKVCGMGRPFECNAADIAAVERVASGRSGNRLYFTVQLRLADGRKIPINWGMEKEDETSYVEALLEDWVHLYRRRESYREKAG
ncbi:MAG: hypothetical protein N2Z21_00220 [Candidatus Sumerlaeaceae bacterium]|nr:hypothetical protein [Candidatus Sumerlaeaceae bacterium]